MPISASNQKEDPKPIARVVFDFDPNTGAQTTHHDGNYPAQLLVNELHKHLARLINAQLVMEAQEMQRQAQKRVVLPDGTLPGGR